MKRILVALMVGTILSITAPATAAVDYTQGVTSLNGTEAKIWFKPTTTSALVDVHYLIAGIPQQNFRMTNKCWHLGKSVSGLTGGTVID